MKCSCTARRNNFDQLLAQSLPALDDSLKSKGQQQIASPQPTGIGATDATHESGGVAGASAGRAAHGLSVGMLFASILPWLTS